jgi:hypothetical protein
LFVLHSACRSYNVIDFDFINIFHTISVSEQRNRGQARSSYIMMEAKTEEPHPTLANAMDNSAGIERDMKELGKLVREKLFYMIIHDLKSSGDDLFRTDGDLCNASILYFHTAANRGKITNQYILLASERDFKQYLRFMWNRGLTTKGNGNIRKVLSNEKSSVYSAINQAFKSKFVSCSCLLLLSLCTNRFLVASA